MSEEKKDLTVVEQQPIVDAFSNMQSFVNAQRICKLLTQSKIVPESYQGEQNLSNAMVALEMANRIGISPVAVMQNLHIIEGRPSWSSSFIISMLNSSGNFTPLRFKYENLGKKDLTRIYKRYNKKLGQMEDVKDEKKGVENISCYAYATDKLTGETIEGPKVTIEMAFNEGWLSKIGSKWQTMPELMLSYRAAAFFGRIYAPELLLGMHTDDELEDFTPPQPIKANPPIVNPDSELQPIISPEEMPEEIEEVEAEIIEEPKPEPQTVEEKVAAITEPQPQKEENPAKKQPDTKAVKSPFMFNFEE